MKKRILEFSVEGTNLKKTGNFENIVKGTSGYLYCRFRFSSDWYGCKVAASFFTKSGEEYPTIVENSMCEIPSEVLGESRFSVVLTGINGDYKIVSRRVYIRQVE